MREYDEFFERYYKDPASVSSDANVVDHLKCNACLVEIVYGAKGLAEDIFANALAIERIRGKVDNNEAYGCANVLDDDDIVSLQDAHDKMRAVYEKTVDKINGSGHAKSGELWVRDGLTQEQWDAKPVDQKVFEASELIVSILLDADPDGEIARRAKGGDA